MTREEWEEVLYANVRDEVVQDRLNQYVLELEAENEKLREQGARLFDKTLELGTKNAKLRELVEAMYTYMADTVEHCGYQTMTTGYTMLGSRLAQCEKQMKALGIEVNG